MILRFCLGLHLLLILLLGGAACSGSVQTTPTPILVGLDHIPVAVKDLDQAAERYRALGFTLKPGRPHENGVRNQHVKFLDGTELELITATEPRDSLAEEYLRHLALGDGAAFLGIYAPDLDRLATWLDTQGEDYLRDDTLLTFPTDHELRYIFFGNRHPSQTDQPEHFEHINGAQGLVGVWIAGDDLTSEHQLLTDLGATIAGERVHVPGSIKAQVARLSDGEIIFLPASRQRVQGRHIVGVTILTSDLDDLRRALATTPWNDPPVIHTRHGHSIFVPPAVAHGLWLEFLQED